jgi:hypothetical protein
MTPERENIARAKLGQLISLIGIDPESAAAVIDRDVLEYMKKKYPDIPVNMIHSLGDIKPGFNAYWEM